MNWAAESLDPISDPKRMQGDKPQREPASKELIRVLLVDDHPVVRHGLRACLRPNSRVAIIGEACNGKEALIQAKELSPDVVLMDIEMPQMDGLLATEILRKQNPKIRVVILSMHSHPEYVMRIIKSGANGYVLKGAPAEELVRAIEDAYAGGTFFSAEIARLALNQIARDGGELKYEDPLSLREREVLIGIAEGLSNKEIASRLGVGVRTVETHRERITHKLKIHTVAGLTKFAIAQGFIPHPNARSQQDQAEG
jgi:two-component system, NarL family, nitrate/nitrite response regulator NarL